jgi:HSP20 family molecular chaperone IbpA
MTSSTLLPLVNDKNSFFRSSNRYSIHDFGQGYRTYSYEFDLIEYEPEQITVSLDNLGRLRIRAYRPLCHEFRREYNLGGPDVETRLVRNTIDTHGRLRVDVDVHPRQYDISSINNNNILTFDLQGYRPKNVNIRINENGLLKINAQHSDETVGHRIDKEYYRQYQLPKNTKPEQIRAKIDENQILTIALPQSLPNQNKSWQPYYDNSYPPGYGKRPYNNSCCSVM